MCVGIERRCDRRKDCADGSDELEENCKCRGMWKCSSCIDETSFKCKDRRDNFQCIDERHVCSGRIDCGYKSDEEGCGYDSPCPGKYQCKGKWIRKNQPCDGKCLETTCNGQCSCWETPCDGKCQEGYRFCPKNDKCVLKDEYKWDCRDNTINKNSILWKCNGVSISKSNACNGTCPSGRHEKNYDTLCGDKCLPGPFAAVNCGGKCVPRYEYKQEYKNNSKWNKPCGDVCPLGFKCKDGSACLTLGSECDGVKDCPDGSDEDQDFCKMCHVSKCLY